MTYREMLREADLISKAAVYHAVKMVKQPPMTATHDPLIMRLNRLWPASQNGGRP